MDKMTATHDTVPSIKDNTFEANNQSSSPKQNMDDDANSSNSDEQVVVNPNIKAAIVGGQDITSVRPLFDINDKNIIVASDRQLLYYDERNLDPAGLARLPLNKHEPDERIAFMDKLEDHVYVFTNHGKVFIWDLKSRDWLKELSLPITDDETLVACKMLTKRQYIYTVRDGETNFVNLYMSISKSERERPRSRELIGQCSDVLNTFDFGFCDITQQSDHAKTAKSKCKSGDIQLRTLAFIFDNQLHVQTITLDTKYSQNDDDKKFVLNIKNHTCACVTVNRQKSMIALGDSVGRIYIYTGQFSIGTFDRTKLHWHALPVTDLCYSSTGLTLFSVGGEAGCVVVWDLTHNNLGKKSVVARLGMPIRHLSCSSMINQLILSFEDNEIQLMSTSNQTRKLKTFTRQTIQIYDENSHKALRQDKENYSPKSLGLVWHSQTDTIVSNARTGWLQFYSPHKQCAVDRFDFLKCGVLSIESDVKVIPSDISKGATSIDGRWMAFYETRSDPNTFPDVRLHIWYRYDLHQQWTWIETIDRVHSSSVIHDLRFSPDGHYLVSISDDGSYQILFRLSLEPKLNEKQMYAKGFKGHIPKGVPAQAAFSQDSSVLAIALENDTTLIMLVVSPYKLIYECQLSQADYNVDSPNGTTHNLPIVHQRVLGLQFGQHQPNENVAPLCDIRPKSIRIWNILSLCKVMNYEVTQLPTESANDDEFTAAAFEQNYVGHESSTDKDYFAVATKQNFIMIFRLQLDRNSLVPLVLIDGSLQITKSPLDHYVAMCFMKNPVLDMDTSSCPNKRGAQLLNRLCLLSSRQELVSFTDKLTLERDAAINNCNQIRSIAASELQNYMSKMTSTYQDEKRAAQSSDITDEASLIAIKQRQIRNRLEVQKMLNNLFMRIPSHNLPHIDVIGPMIIDKLI